MRLQLDGKPAVLQLGDSIIFEVKHGLIGFARVSIPFMFVGKGVGDEDNKMPIYALAGDKHASRHDAARLIAAVVGLSAKETRKDAELEIYELCEEE